LAIRGHGDRRGPTIGEIADYLVLRHHSAVGLIDRAVAAGLVVRSHDDERPGTVSLSLTTLGGKRLDALAASHMEELARLAPTMEVLWRTVDQRMSAPHP
jgi:DNA-binding MarR family transcriptional regulator